MRGSDRLVGYSVRVALELFKAKGWAKVQGMQGFISITPAGIEQARILRTPKWRLWMKDRTIVVPIITALVGTIVGAFLSQAVPPLRRFPFGPR
jgi:hypothetical protein